MDLDLTPDQISLQETVRRFLDTEVPLSTARENVDTELGYEPKYWQQCVQLGFTSMLVPAEYGGGSLTDEPVRDLVIIAEEVGRAIAGGPVVPCNIVAAALSRSPNVAEFATVLSQLAGGEAIGTWAVAESGAGWSLASSSTVITEQPQGLVLQGVKTLVEAGESADFFLVTAQGPQGLMQVLVPAGADGVTTEGMQSLDMVRRFATVTFNDVHIGAGDVVSDAETAGTDVERQLCLALALQCAETVGAVERIFDVLLEYVQDRVAFGRPIGSYQALKHRLADHKLWLEASLGLSTGLAGAFADDAIPSELASAAKAHIGEQSIEIIQDCVQMFGGIGVTWEHDAHLFLRRAATNYGLYGSPADHRERLCVLAGV